MEDLSGKRVIITGATHGIGFEAAKELAAKGADVVMAVRNVDKGEKAAENIRSTYPSASVTVMNLNLADLGSVKEFASEYAARFDRIDVLINNAGVMMPPYKRTRDGFELQFGTNHLGHFALTASLLPLIMSTPLSRVVTVSSIAARKGRINFKNLDGSHGYNPMTFYRQSKLANLLFSKELQHRLERAGSSGISILCHPGITATNILSRGSGKETFGPLKNLMRVVVQPAERGALPTLYAATHPDLRGGECIGPDNRNNTRGYPVLTDDANRLFDPDLSARLWEVSESLTGVKFAI
jgi:NAD(P)-dependent dehydrogenase (short-subunit alcohol dehydrogenase family)